MPYPVDTVVPAALLHLLETRVGRSRARRLLNDHLDNPNDLVTEAAITAAIGGEIGIKRGLGKRRDTGYDATTTVEFKTTIGEREWDGRTLEVDPLPETIRIAAVGRRIEELIDEPLIGGGVIREIKEIKTPDGDEASVIVVDGDTRTMAQIRPGLVTRLVASRRRAMRRTLLARRLRAHLGFRIWIPFASIFGVVCGFMAMGFGTMAVLSPFMTMKQADPWATPMALLGAVIGYVWCWVGGVYFVNEDGIVDEHARTTIRQAISDGV